MVLAFKKLTVRGETYTLLLHLIVIQKKIGGEENMRKIDNFGK